jgi:hypothetical protein
MKKIIRRITLFFMVLGMASSCLAVFTTNPNTGVWSSQSTITVTWSALTNFSNVSGYLYVFDQNVATSTSQGSYTFTQSTSATSSVLSPGEYYFHVWSVSMSGAISPVVYTIGAFFLDPNAANLPVVGNIPDIKLLDNASSINIFSLANYVNNSAVNWSWAIDTAWKYNVNLGTQITQAGTQMTYAANTVIPIVGQERIKYSADGVFNHRSILKLSSNLWSQQFPDAIFQNGQPVENTVVPLMSYLTTASGFTTTGFSASVVDSQYVSVNVNSTSLTLNASSTLNFPARIRVNVTGSNSTMDWDSQILWARENWLLNGDFLSDVTSYWVYLNFGITTYTTNWLPVVDSQTGVMQLTQWGNSSIEMVQNVNNNPNSGSPYISVHGGSWYTLRGNFKTDNPTAPRTLSIQIHGYAGYGNSTDLTSVGLATLALTTVWQEYEVSFYSRANLAAVAIVSFLHNASTTSVYMNNLQLIEKEPAVNTAYGNTHIPLVNGNFANGLSGWGFQSVYGPLQGQDTGWLASYNGQNGVCVLNATTSGRTKFTQYVSFSDSSSHSLRLRVWAATSAVNQNISPILVMVYNTYDAHTTQITNVMGYASFHVIANGEWAEYDFVCPVSAPLVAIQLQGWGLYSTNLYLTNIQVDREQDLPCYWSNEEINETELIQVDTAKTMFFTTAQSNERYIPYGSNFHDNAGFGLQDQWWYPYSEDSFTSLFLDKDFNLLQSIGGNVVKVAFLLSDFLPDFDPEFTPTDTTGEYFPTYQSVTNVQIPSRILERLDEVLASAKRHHLRVILTIYFNTPQMNWWLADGGNYGDTTRQILSQFWTTIAQRYDNDPCLLSYSLLVEHWLQMREWADTNYAYSLAQIDTYFTAPVTAKWQQWLTTKYGNINSLNTTWSAISSNYLIYATGLPYANFSSIPIPGFDGKNTPGSSAFTGGVGGGGDSTYHIPDGPILLSSGTNSVLQWIPSGDTTYLNLYYIWREEKSAMDPTDFGTTWQFRQPVGTSPLNYTDYNTSNLSTYRYAVTGGNVDAWRNYPEGTQGNQNATYDPMLFDFLQFRESIVDEYDYNQSSTIVQTETHGNFSTTRHLTSTGLAQFDYLLRWTAAQRLWGDGPSLTPEGPHSTLGFNPKELGKSLDFSEESFYTGLPNPPTSPDNPNQGYPIIDANGNIDYQNEMVTLQYLRTLLRLFYTNANPALLKPILLKEFSGAATGANALQQNCQWNNLVLDYTPGETAGWLIWYFTDDNYGLYNSGFAITPWGQSFQGRADDIKNTEYTYPAGTQTLTMTGGISTTSNYMFLMTSSHYRDDTISPQYDPTGTYQSLGKILQSVDQGIYLPSDHLDLYWPDNSTIIEKPGF